MLRGYHFTPPQGSRRDMSKRSVNTLLTNAWTMKNHPWAAFKGVSPPKAGDESQKTIVTCLCTFKCVGFRLALVIGPYRKGRSPPLFLSLLVFTLLFAFAFGLACAFL